MQCCIAIVGRGGVHVYFKTSCLWCEPFKNAALTLPHLASLQFCNGITLCKLVMRYLNICMHMHHFFIFVLLIFFSNWHWFVFWDFWNSSFALLLCIEHCLWVVLASFCFQPWVLLFWLPWLNLLSVRFPKFPSVWNTNRWAACHLFY